MPDYQDVLKKITEDERYRANVNWGQPRPSHPEGTIAAHIEELEGNLEHLKERLSDEEYWKLKVLIHVHDICKPDARRTVSINHPESHASLGREFLTGFTKDKDLLAMAQYHDVHYSMYQRWRKSGELDEKRMDDLVKAVKDWDLFSAFLLIDGCTIGKQRETLHWFFGQLNGQKETRFSAADIW
ncbi:MAG: hypothetical protein DWQ07_11675 [Chloroflexi bacterium]|nr:MAG: hypothetical protein DWQ07_11675 [Chloroflexota bacterium]MBL1197135.1 hypothetical protein [Chloroflexota bacterium]NOH14430.1 hypothetical protein [Chloroflexota bacterium]